MPVRNQPPTRFSDEIRLISPVAYFIALLAFVGIQVLFATVMAHDHNAPPLLARAAMGIVAGSLSAVYVLLIGYVNRDAARRGMSRVLWTLVAIFVPNALGIVLYFILRKPRLAACPQCGTNVEPGFSFCPKCRFRLQPVCPHCQRGVEHGDSFCPYCGGALGVGTSETVPPAQV
jgi:RNA polymerase subunit RPABC4/transcription elongation factor Spt4